jgi:disulfide bond formation protein DsbB
MDFLKDLLLSPRRVFVLPLLTGVGLVGSGLVLAAIANLAACPLCIVQRMLYLLVSAVALIGLLMPRAGRVLAGLLLLAASATGAFVAGYQVWLQRFAQGETCAAQETWWERLVDWAGTQAPWLFLGNGMCTDRSWTFLSFSIADWSLIIFSGLAIYAIHALLRQRSPIAG